MNVNVARALSGAPPTRNGVYAVASRLYRDEKSRLMGDSGNEDGMLRNFDRATLRVLTANSNLVGNSGSSHPRNYRRVTPVGKRAPAPVTTVPLPIAPVPLVIVIPPVGGSVNAPVLN